VIAWQLKRFNASELGAPVVLEPLQVSAPEALPLPERVVLVSNTELLQPGGTAGAMRVVELHQIPGQHGARPAIGGDVVVVDQQQVTVAVNGQKPGTQQQA
jgi:hypothetical protein